MYWNSYEAAQGISWAGGDLIFFSLSPLTMVESLSCLFNKDWFIIF